MGGALALGNTISTPIPTLGTRAWPRAALAGVSLKGSVQRWGGAPQELLGELDGSREACQVKARPWVEPSQGRAGQRSGREAS